MNKRNKHHFAEAQFNSKVCFDGEEIKQARRQGGGAPVLLPPPPGINGQRLKSGVMGKK